MPRTVYLLRHAMPDLDATQPPDRWRLSAEGRAAVSALRGTLPATATVLASDEPKAVETALLACGIAPTADARFGEVRRPREPFSPDPRATRRAWVEGRIGDAHRGWESPEDAAARFADGIGRYKGDLVVATHGMVLVAWLVGIGHTAPGVSAGEAWAGLAFPDVVRVEIP